MPRLSRREFLENTAAATAAAATVSLSLGCTAPQQQTEKVRTAVVGVGGRGNGHINEFLRKPNCHLGAICEVDEGIGRARVQGIQAALRKAGKPVHEIKVYKDIRELIDDEGVDAVSIATPNHWHALAGIWAMQKGKDAYIEKPVCHNIVEGTALIATARKYERMCQVGTQCRSSVAVQEAVKFMESGGIGEVNFARGLCYKRRPSIGAKGNYIIPREVDFDLWSGPATFTDPKLTRKKFHYDWHWQRHYGNGDLGNQGPHQTDIARWGLGIDTHPSAIVTYGGRLGYQAEKKDPKYVDAGDTANTEVSVYDYGDKCIVFETRGLDVTDSDDKEINTLFQREKGKRGNIIGVIFYGTEGYVVQKSYSHCLAFDKQMKLVKEFKGGGDHFANFAGACQTRDRDALNADVREGHLSAGISHLGNISYYMGESNKVSVAEAQKAMADIPGLDDNSATLQRTVKHLMRNGVDLDKYPLSMGPLLKFDPEKEVFPDSSEATALLGRPYREGFVCPTAESV